MKRSRLRPEVYLRYLLPSTLFHTHRTRQILNINPTVEQPRPEAEKIAVSVFNYNDEKVEEANYDNVHAIFPCRDNGMTSWINIDGIRKADVEEVCEHFGIHQLLQEDIMSRHQRPKMDEVDGVLYCLLNMLYFDEKAGSVEVEQISIILGKDFVITFQEDPQRDVFNAIRERLKLHNTKLRQRRADYLCYSLLDMIVDSYYLVMEKLGNRMEALEEEVIRNTNNVAMANINNLRKELIVLKRNIAPVRDLVSGIIRSESDLLEEGTTKYFKDVYDHIIQAYDLSENYRDVMLSMQDLYLNNVNLRMNEVMKVMAIVTCLMAPATVIGGIFGMNFDIIPTAHNEWGFYIAVGLMVFVPVAMLVAFKRRGWF